MLDFRLFENPWKIPGTLRVGLEFFLFTSGLEVLVILESVLTGPCFVCFRV